MNRTRKEVTVKRYQYPSQQLLKEHLCLFLKAYNFAKRLKTLRGLTADEKIIQCRKNESDRFMNHPNYHTLRLKKYPIIFTTAGEHMKNLDNEQGVLYDTDRYQRTS